MHRYVSLFAAHGLCCLNKDIVVLDNKDNVSLQASAIQPAGLC
jgi:hypothetical protein